MNMRRINTKDGLSFVLVSSRRALGGSASQLDGKTPSVAGKRISGQAAAQPRVKRAKKIKLDVSWGEEEEEGRCINWDEVESDDTASQIPSLSKNQGEARSQISVPGTTACAPVTFKLEEGVERHNAVVGQPNLHAAQAEAQRAAQRGAAKDVEECWHQSYVDTFQGWLVDPEAT